jgi:hypothetical protein
MLAVWGAEDFMKNKIHNNFGNCLFILFFIMFLGGCKTTLDTNSSTAVTKPTRLAPLSVTSIGSAGGTQVTYTAPSGESYSPISVDLGSGFLAANFCSSSTIFGLSGTASNVVPGTSILVANSIVLASNASRAIGTTQISQGAETTTYQGKSLPSGYRENPDINLDDDGWYNLDAGCGGVSCTPVISVTTAQHNAFAVCGTALATIPLRISDCVTQNGTNATWVGATNGNKGEATWSLVTRNAGNQEVWQDQRTGLLWSSVSGVMNWCQGVGNNDPADPDAGFTCIGNTTSACSENLFTGAPATPAFAGDTFVTGPYDVAKGGMGVGSAPSVYWRAPTEYDYRQAIVDGLFFVMPDIGGNSVGNVEFMATLSSKAANRAQVWFMNNKTGQFNVGGPHRTNTGYIRCVGR